jgi:diaminohydroxyphosphoribosylaminopyrimidine deaminase/5-amino-6-(5-phosphoribosylamino)uracil reductase
LIDAGVARVLVAMEDPNPLVAGRGLGRLREAGIEVRCGLLADEAEELNLGFVSRMTRGLPWVRLKVAASLDGRTALPDGRSQWITGAAARADGHAWRARACAILTGIGTVRDDDPRLTVRDLPESDGAQIGQAVGQSVGQSMEQSIRQPLRVLVDSRLEVEPSAKLVRAGGLLLAHALSEDWLAMGPLADKARLLQDHGVELWSSSTSSSDSASTSSPGKVDLGALLAELARRGVNELHVEAGAGLNGSFIREARVDELLLYLAPALLGDSRAMFNLAPPDALESAKRLYFHEMVKLGDDLRILARFKQDAIQ